jgi:3-hydroxyisobutyrate dehydrogenase-like beta-hydroxyacid dehydrogenase
VFVEVLAKGGGGSVALERLKPYLLNHDTSSLRFAMANAEKDLGYYATMAHDVLAADAIATAVWHTYARAAADGGPEALAVELSSWLTARGAIDPAS